MSGNTSITPWSATDAVVIPASATPDSMLEFAKSQLSSRDVKAIVSAFRDGSYEMIANFVWTKAAAVLKKQIASLGMEFVGEMLGRPDIKEDSDPATSVADHEAIALAEDLGMITTTQAVRLKHALELVAHFANLDQDAAEDEMMQSEEAASLLRTCITSILGKPRFEAAVRFAEFRRALSERPLKESDGSVSAVLGSPYFFRRTTLSVLLTLVKAETKGAATEHALGNTSLLIPLMWPQLRQQEKVQVGQIYAEVTADGKSEAATALKKALIKVHGFDFVPENLRSSTFTEAASRVLDAHFGFNNFYKEEEPASVLANLGTAIPRPAFAKCMEAAVAVYTGNPYGVSNSAVPHARRILDGLRPQQWEYYVNECLRSDRTLLDKLTGHQKPIARWIHLSSHYDLHKIQVSDLRIRDLIEATDRSAKGKIEQCAVALRGEINA